MTGSQEVIGSIPFSSILGGFQKEIAFFLFLSCAYCPNGQYGSTSSAYWPDGQYGYAGYAYCPNGQYGYAGYAYWPGGQYGYAGCAISLPLNTRNDALFRLRSIRALPHPQPPPQGGGCPRPTGAVLIKDQFLTVEDYTPSSSHDLTNSINA